MLPNVQYDELGRGVSLTVGVVNVLLGLAAALACLLPFVVWLYVALYTFPLPGVFVATLWLWTGVSALLFFVNGVRALSEHRWGLRLQLWPFVGGFVLCLLVFLTGGWKLLFAYLGWL